MYKTNVIIHRNLKLPTIRKIIHNIKYEKEKLKTRLDELTSNLLDKNLVIKRLKRFKPVDLQKRLTRTNKF